MKSEFGECVLNIRVKNDESLRDMAKRLGITAAFLSAMEVGRKTIPIEYADKIAKEYKLNQDEKDKLLDSIYKSNSKVSIELAKMTEAQKKTSLLFARRIQNADEDLIKKLQEVLNSDKDECSKR